MALKGRQEHCTPYMYLRIRKFNLYLFIMDSMMFLSEIRSLIKGMTNIKIGITRLD